MLARLQQALTLAALLAAGLWAVLCWQAGRPVAAVAGVALVMGAHALVLALEFLFLAAIHRRSHRNGSDPTPIAAAGPLLRAWWGEVRAAPAVFCWRQPFRSTRFPDQLPEDARGRLGVLFVHGFVCNRGLWNPWLRRLQSQGVPFVAVNMEPVFGPIEDGMSVIDAAIDALERCTGRAPVVVAHSMGGLAVRCWAAGRGGSSRVAHLITIGTPHRGTWLARYGTSPNARQMRTGSPWLVRLAEQETPALAQRCTCFYSHADNIVFPPLSATWPGADHRHLPAVAHVHMADRPEPWAELQRLLQAAPAVQTPN